MAELTGKNVKPSQFMFDRLVHLYAKVYIRVGGLYVCEVESDLINIGLFVLGPFSIKTGMVLSVL